MLPNGPAIWGGCVTRRSIRAGSWYFSQKIVTVQGGYAVPRTEGRGHAFLPVMVGVRLSHTCFAPRPVRAKRVTGVQVC
jgi:hypothetical protein